MRSTILGKIFPYIGFLEDEISRLREENRRWQDRVLLLTTGAPLEIPKEDLAETAPQKSPRLAELQKKIDDEINTSYPTMASLLSKIEHEGFLEDAQIEPETSPANYLASEEELTDEQQKAQDVVKRKFFTAAARAKEEYLRRVNPQFTNQEKAANN